ncbi:MAG: cation transporting ATPase C-terminal domain-containing protein, partial [Ruminococcus sp.]
MILSQLIPIFGCKSETKSLLHLPLWNNWKLLAAVAVSAGILFAAVESSALQMIFTTVPLSLPLWI